MSLLTLGSVTRSLLCFLCCWISQPAAADVHWTYGHGDHCPDHWKYFYSDCGLRRQSPIDIKPNEVISEVFGPIQFMNYGNTRVQMQLKNNGHAAQVDISSGKAFIKGSDLAHSTYQLAQLHFHWGADSSRGSEHTVDGYAYPGEMHFVHYNTRYFNLSQAAVQPRSGLAVLGVFIEVGPEDNTNFASIINGLAAVTHPGSTKAIDSVRLESLLPSNTEEFYRYSGSLTTPGCHESVQWTVFKNPIYLSEAQLSEFRKLMDSEDSPLVDNYRPTLQLNGRGVYINRGGR